MPDRFQHPPHLPVAALANRDLHDTLTASKRRTFRSACALASSVEQRGFRRKRASPIERDPFAQLPQGLSAPWAGVPFAVAVELGVLLGVLGAVIGG